jgi:sulfatase maturation enzyme AslB (radical SAM superfamily)
MRHNEPSHVIQWREAIANPPKCCHTCDWYDKDGVCGFHKSEPPEDFAATNGACESWIQEMPF